jgi:hypothetical protein
MGLDMYLEKRSYVKNWDHNKNKHSITVKYNNKVRKDIDLNKISGIVEEVLYWRKANAIHNWFVKNCQDGNDDCRSYYVTREKLQELVDLCDEVIETKDVSLLETASGFFFGSTEYDNYYFDDLKRTSAVIKNELLNKHPEGCWNPEYYYQSSW